MTLLGAILKKVKSTESISGKYTSPPPELEVEKVVATKKKKIDSKYDHVHAKVDATAPRLVPSWRRTLLASRSALDELHADNVRLVIAIHYAHLTGKVDNRWDKLPPGSNQYYEKRVSFLKQAQAENKQLYKRIVTTPPRVVTTASLRRDWSFNRNDIIRRAQTSFVLFPPVPTQHVEDAAFLPPAGVKRPRVRLSLRFRGGAALGDLVVELFSDVCPDTCGLFLELLDGDQLGHGYVGTRFFRKVPGLFWSGGDVIYDNGFGCYAQRGRAYPIGAQNFHFSHSMPGLLSMRVTKDNEMCGIFNITFKALPQFDLKNEVFGRVIRPCSTYDSISAIGSALSDQPVVELAAARRRLRAHWVHGVPNTRIIRNFRGLKDIQSCRDTSQ